MNVTNIISYVTNITSSASTIGTGSIFTSLLPIIIILILLILVIRFFLSTFVPKFTMFTTILLVSYLLAYAYYIPNYIPKNFVIVTNNTTIVNTEVVSSLTSMQNMIFIPAFYDSLMYYMVKYGLPESDLYIPYSVLLLFLIYFIYALYGSIGKLAIPVGFALLFITTFGMKGLLYSSLIYSNILFMNISLALIAVLFALVK